jgi:aminoglycoside phosphotransferase family enzyme/predicted kinase
MWVESVRGVSRNRKPPLGQVTLEAPTQFEEICQAMADPTFYPHEVSRLERRDTHISTVFLTGKWAYKIKKPVDFGFLNFADLESRRYYCEQEVRLNQRLSHGVYQEAMPIRRDENNRFRPGSGGEVVEYAVRMKQLDEKESLLWLLESGGISGADMQRLGWLLADFYETSLRNAEIDQYGHADVIAFNMEENFFQIGPFVDDLVSPEDFEFIRQVSRAFFLSHGGLFERRMEMERIRDGHGDLRCDHIYFCNGIHIIDCIEFNDRFRYGDVISDLAFLHMDLEHRGGHELSLTFLAAYAERARDFEVYALLDFYASYRAVVKVKVACLRSTEVHCAKEKEALKAEARSYLLQAYRYALQFSRPTIWVMMGLPASGKSSLGEAMAEKLSLPLLQSDAIRKELAGRQIHQAEIVHYDGGIYQSSMRQRVYAKMLTSAQEELKQGHSVVLDATFSKSRWRDEVRQLASDLDTNLIFVECACGEEIIRWRLEEREGQGGISDARLMHLPRMILEYEAPHEMDSVHLVRVDTSLPFSETLSRILSEGYAKRCLQVRTLYMKISPEI